MQLSYGSKTSKQHTVNSKQAESPKRNSRFLWLSAVCCLLFASGLILYQRPHVVTFEFLTAGQKFQFRHKHQAHYCSAQAFDQIANRICRCAAIPEGRGSSVAAV
jgi:hypothetical protein